LRNRSWRLKRLLLVLGLRGTILASGLSSIIPATIAITNADSQLLATFSLANDFGIDLKFSMFVSWESSNCLKEVEAGYDERWVDERIICFSKRNKAMDTS
jgi:hypothetical protein